MSPSQLTFRNKITLLHRHLRPVEPIRTTNSYLVNLTDTPGFSGVILHVFAASSVLETTGVAAHGEENQRDSKCLRRGDGENCIQLEWQGKDDGFSQGLAKSPFGGAGPRNTI